MIWRCPSCRGQLIESAARCSCSACGASYEIIFGIPDLRPPNSRDEVTQQDRANARQLALAASAMTAEEMLGDFFRNREGAAGWTERDTQLRVSQTLALPARLRRDFDEWLAPLRRSDVFLDIGCGFGGLLSAAESLGMHGVGVDNRMSVLIVAKRLIEREGGVATLACADAGALPLGDESVGAIVMHDVVEHIMELDAALREADRVTVSNGAFACSTPNRFTLGPEPHVHIWGVGWLPRKYQTQYVRWRGGMDYTGTELKSVRELIGIVRRTTHFDVTASVAAIPAMEIAVARGARRVLARGYNFSLRSGVLRKIFLAIGPFFQIIGIKRTAHKTH